MQGTLNFGDPMPPFSCLLLCFSASPPVSIKGADLGPKPLTVTPSVDLSWKY